MLEGYLLTLTDMLLAAIGIGIFSMLAYKLLPRLGLSREAATGYALIMPWLLGFALKSAQHQPTPRMMLSPYVSAHG